MPIRAISFRNANKMYVVPKPPQKISIDYLNNFNSTQNLYTPLSHYSQTPLCYQGFVPKTTRYLNQDLKGGFFGQQKPESNRNYQNLRIQTTASPFLNAR